MSKHYRRKVLKRTASLGALAAVPASVSARGTGGSLESASPIDADGPTRVVGTRQIRAEYSASEIVFEERYIGKALEKNYGRPSMVFDRRIVDRSSLGPERDAEFPVRGVDVQQFNLDKLVGTRAEWERYYEQQIDQADSEIGTQSIDYFGPIWEWGTDDGGDTYTKKAPINVIFDTSNSLSQVTNVIGNNGYHGLPICAKTKYVKVFENDSLVFIPQDDQMGTQNICGNSQNHIRLWNATNLTHGDDHVASIHWDPIGHDKGCLWGNFEFESAESDMRSLWENNTSATVHSTDLGNANTWSGCKESNDSQAAVIHW